MPSFTESSIPRRIMTQITVFIGTGTCTIESNYVTVGGGGSGGELGAHSISVRIKYAINKQTGELVIKFSLNTNYYKYSILCHLRLRNNMLGCIN
jgi:hypothetical protein